MSKIAHALLVACLCGLSASTGAAADDIDRRCTEIRVAGAEQWIPFSFRDQVSGEPHGIAIDLVRWLGRRMQIPVSIRADLPWKRLMLASEHDAVDLIAGVYGTEAQASRFALTDRFESDEVRVFVAQGREFSYKEPADLIGKRGATLIGIRWSAAFEEARPRLSLDEVIEHRAALQMLLVHRVDYVVMPLLTARYWLSEFDAARNVVALPTPVATHTVHLAIVPGSPCHARLAEINHLLSLAQASGVMEGIVRAYARDGAGSQKAKKVP